MIDRVWVEDLQDAAYEFARIEYALSKVRAQRKRCTEAVPMEAETGYFVPRCRDAEGLEKSEWCEACLATSEAFKNYADLKRKRALARAKVIRRFKKGVLAK